jgi:hypothetical protein
MSFMTRLLRRGPLAGFLQQNLNSRGKRIVFLASLAAQVSNANHFDKETRHKLNELMQLARGDTALVLPYELSAVIWEGKSGKEIFHVDPATGELTQDSIQQMTRSVVAAMPEWLRYGAPDQIEQDVGKLLENRNAVFGF